MQNIDEKMYILILECKVRVNFTYLYGCHNIFPQNLSSYM